MIHDPKAAMQALAGQGEPETVESILAECIYRLGARRAKTEENYELQRLREENTRLDEQVKLLRMTTDYAIEMIRKEAK